MAARLNPRQDARCRAAIQTTQLCKRLNLFALNLPDPHTLDKRPVEMTDTQVRAALGLLRKTLPDLAVTQISGDPDRPVMIDVQWAPAMAEPQQQAVLEAEPLTVEFQAIDED